MAEAVAAPGVTLREATRADWPLILNSWLRSYADSAHARSMRRDVYDAGQHAVAMALLTRHGARCAVLDDASSVILGWACVSAGTLHYVYVKHDFRHAGIGRLLAGEFRQHTHITPAGARLARASVYNPYEAHRG